MHITVLGGGSFGTALAIHLHNNGHQVRVWEFNASQAQAMRESRICPLMPEAAIPPSVEITHDLAESLSQTNLIIVAVPSDKVALTIKNAVNYITNQPMVICSKGFGEGRSLLHDQVAEIATGSEVYCLYGPTIAKELALGHHAGMVLAGIGSGRSRIREVFASKNLIIEESDDIIGVQVASALKNVITILVGIMEGAELGENTKALAYVHGLSEISILGEALGAKRETFYGLCGMGDLLLRSRNRQLGIELGKGRKLDEILTEHGHVHEGLLAIDNALHLASKVKIELPLVKRLKEFLQAERHVSALLH